LSFVAAEAFTCAVFASAVRFPATAERLGIFLGIPAPRARIRDRETPRIVRERMEAPPGFEPGMEVLQIS
jgi:hypothetical protein